MGEAVRKTIYIAGPMTGIPEYNYPAFFDAEEQLREKGWLVNNPASLRAVNKSDFPSAVEVWRYYMRRTIPMLLQSSELALLPGWGDSKGARLEYLIAANLGMAAWDYRDGVLHLAGTTPAGVVVEPMVDQPTGNR